MRRNWTRAAKQGMGMGLILVLGMGFAAAEGLVGKRHARLLAGVTEPGDSALKSIDKSWFTAGAVSNLPLTEKVDFQLLYHFRDIDGSLSEGTLWDLHGGLLYHFTPQRRWNPFLTLAVNYSEQKGVLRPDGLLNERKKITGAGLGVGGGIEHKWDNGISMQGTLQYLDIYDDRDFHGGLMAHIWFAPNFGMSAEVRYAFDQENVTYLLGLTLDI